MWVFETDICIFSRQIYYRIHKTFLSRGLLFGTRPDAVGRTCVIYDVKNAVGPVPNKTSARRARAFLAKFSCDRGQAMILFYDAIKTIN